MAGTAKLLVLRFSAMGDVAMTAPVLKELRAQYPDLELMVVSRAQFQAFFSEISKLSFHAIEPKGKHQGLFGLWKLFTELRTANITAVADLHSNLRSKIISKLFALAGIKTASLDKGRSEKKQLTRKNDKQLVPLKLTVQRYAEVFAKLGYRFVLQNQLNKISFHEEAPVQSEKNTDTSQVDQELYKTQNSNQSDQRQPVGELNKINPDHDNNLNKNLSKKIGVSPFAQHQQKVYPLHKMEEVLINLADQGHQLYIFGGSQEEAQTAAAWAEKHPNIKSLVRKMNLEEELQFISGLDLMLSMDSSGMHLASLQNIPVVSVWGATHPYAGFLGYGQSIYDAVQLDLYCRPCSVYGNVPCYRGDFACMNNIEPQLVVDKVLAKLNHD